MRRMLPVACVVVLVSTATAADAAWKPPATWLAQARCVHALEGSWRANTGNGYFGGFQFAAQTWRRLGGAHVAALSHPGNARFPFKVSMHEQLYRAWLLWQHDGGSWRSWGANGAACSDALP